MPAGASLKREREYQELKREFLESGRYKGREEEVAARIVNKQRAQFGETREERARERRGESPDRGLPITHYEHKTIAEIEHDLDRLSRRDLQRIRTYEQKHKRRKGMLARIDRALENA